MAESIVQVTEGAGKKLHTNSRVIGANTVEDEVVILGEQYLATYTVLAAPSTATANSHLIQVMAGAALKVRIRRIDVSQFQLATAAAIMDLVVVRLTTAGTGGAVGTPTPLETTDAASGATSMALPTVKGTEGAVVDAGNAYLMQTAGASTPQVQPLWTWDFDRPRSKPLILQAGTTVGIAVKNLTAHAGGGVRIRVLFDETNF
jgi:hypothetical protein